MLFYVTDLPLCLSIFLRSRPEHFLFCTCNTCFKAFFFLKQQHVVVPKVASAAAVDPYNKLNFSASPSRTSFFRLAQSIDPISFGSSKKMCSVVRFNCSVFLCLTCLIIKMNCVLPMPGKVYRNDRTTAQQPISYFTATANKSYILAKSFPGRQSRNYIQAEPFRVIVQLAEFRLLPTRITVLLMLYPVSSFFYNVRSRVFLYR